jgi:hypothetical protein
MIMGVRLPSTNQQYEYNIMNNKNLKEYQNKVPPYYLSIKVFRHIYKGAEARRITNVFGIIYGHACMEQGLCIAKLSTISEESMYGIKAVRESIATCISDGFLADVTPKRLFKSATHWYKPNIKALWRAWHKVQK